MTKINLSCAGANLRVQVHGEITAGMRGIAVEISFDEAWQGLTPVLVVDCAETVRKMAVDAAGRSSIPWECCIGGEKLNVGVCGLNADGTVKLPTVWASCGKVLDSADDAQAEESSAPPTPSLLEQITALANQAQAAAHAVTEAAQRGDFDGATPEFSIGTVATLPAASPASASVTGTVRNPILNLGIPAGKDGVPPNIQVGTVTTVPNGTPAAVRRRGTEESPVFDFDIPMGADGRKGADAAADPMLELRVKKLEAAAEGNLFLFWADSTEGYSKTVPDDAMRYAALDKIGGRTAVQDGVPVRADVESVVCEGININSTGIEYGHYINQNGEKRTTSSAKGNYAGMLDKVKCLPNTEYTVTLSGIKSDDVTYVHRAWYDRSGSFIARTSMLSQDGLKGTFTYRFTTTDSTDYLYCYAYSAGGLQMLADAGLMIAKGADIPYTPYVQREYPIPAAVRSLPGYGETGAIVDFEGKTYTAPDGTQTDISDMLPDGFENIEVEAGGRITFRQSGGLELPVPNQETYMIKLGGSHT